MALAPGTRLGPFEISAQLGVGGMGEVYRATDTNLKRQVAIKVLPDVVAADADRLARFQREAEVLAALNHPNIAAIHGLERSGPVTALVMELVEGPTLADRILQGPIPVDETLAIARQIADALEAAHERGIIHRDLKPANIKVRPDGTVKVLDFGLAKAMEPVDPSSPSVTQSPTITTPAMTQMGMILGTAAYMSPEQARGKPVDKRADIWAFGVVLFEMLTGRRAFAGDEVSDTLAFVLAREPEWAVVPESVPVAVRKLLRRCLEKERSKRLADIADARFDIDEALNAPAPVAVIGSSAPLPRWRRALPWAIAGLALFSTAATLSLWAPWRARAEAPLVRVTGDVGADVSVTGQGAVALSPDGTTLAFIAGAPGDNSGIASTQLYIRRLDRLDATPVTGATPAASPFFSPDGQWIGFASSGVLKKVSVSGGAVVTVTDAPAFRGGSWGEDDTIVFSSQRDGGALMRVPAAGGEPQTITRPSKPGVFGHITPQMLPNGRGILYAIPPDTVAFDDATIMVLPLPTGEPMVLHRGGYYPHYLPSGHLSWVRDGTLFAAAFDLESLRVTGQAVPVLEGLTGPILGSALVSLSTRGTLAYLPNETAGGSNQGPMMWFDRSDATRPLRAAPATWATPRFSPDGSRLAMTVSDGRQADIWIYDIERDTLTRLTSDPAIDVSPVWTPDGTRVAYGSNRGGGGISNLYWQRADGTGAVERLTESPEPQLPGSFHPDGRFLAFHQGNPTQRGQTIQILPIDGNETSGWKPGQSTEFRRGGGIMSFPKFSPDGKWLAYASFELGLQSQVYVQPFPSGAGRWQVSSSGGNMPMWSRTRRELFFAAPSETAAAGQDRMMVVTYSADGNTFSPNRAAPWSEVRFSVLPPFGTYGPGVDLHPDGQRFVVPPARSPESETQRRQLVFVFNFFDELRRLAPPTP